MSSVIIDLIRIRFLQLFREIKDVGMLRAIFLLALLLPMLVWFLYQKLPIPEYSYGVGGLTLFLVFMIHRNRKDYYFLSKLSNPPVWMYFVEYFVFSIPLLVLFIICRQYLQASLYATLLLPVGFMIPSPKGVKSYTKIIRHIPSGMFEWQSGFRKNLPVIVLFYVTGLAGIYKIWFTAVAVALLVMVFCTFYAENESRGMLAASEQNPARFLVSKLLRHTRYWILWLLPLFLLAFIHYEYWLYILVGFAAMINFSAFTVLSKYAFYRPATVAGISQLIGGIGGLFTIILPLSVFVFITNFVLFFKAKRNLTYYLDAYH